MKKKPAVNDDLRSHYDFDYAKAKPNRFAARLPRGRVIGIVLEEDVAEVFDSSEAVNRFLRSAIEAMPERARRPGRAATVTKKTTKRRAG